MAHLPEGIAWQTVSYPIKLMREEASLPLGVLTLSWFASFAIEATFLAMGWSASADRLDVETLLFGALRYLPSSILAAVLTALVLLRLGSRPAALRFSVRDGLLVTAVWMSLSVVTAPLTLAWFLNDRTNLPLWSGVIEFGLIAVSVYVGLRLSFATPLTLATGRLHVFASWRETRSLFWNLLGIYALIVAAFAVPMFVLMIIVGYPSIPDPNALPVFGRATDAQLVQAGFMNALSALAMIYMTTAQAYLFHRLWPREKWEGLFGPVVAST